MDRRRAGALLALAACIACSAAAPTTSNHTALDLYDGAPEGCYYNFQHYGEGDRIMTNEPCLNCTCHNRMLMCYLRVCPFTKPIGQDCTIEKRADQCCPIVTCPDVPVDLLTSTSTTSPAEYGATGLGKHDKYGCSMNGKYFPEGSKVPPTPNKPCEHCYCIRNMTTCVMQECTLHVDGCTPIYHKDVCCPVRYSCDHPEDEMPLLDDMSTTVRPTPGFLLTTTTIAPVTQMTQDCVHDDRVFADGALIKTEKACEHCYCMKGDIVCVVQECGTPMENEGKNCTSLPPREGQCCPDTYICEGDELGAELPADSTTESVDDTPTTLLPPRRTGIEGSGYRNEPDEVPDIPEHEGSGEEQVTLAPYDRTEKIASETPVETDEPVAATVEGQYSSYTTKSPSFEELEHTTGNEIPGEIESQEYIPAATDVPVETSDEINTTEENIIQEGVTKKDGFAPHEPIPTTLTPEIYDKITTESGEAFNTVPDSITKDEDIEAHKDIPSPIIASAEESERTTPSTTDEEIATSGLSEDITTEPELFYPSPTTSAEETSDTTKEHGVITLDLTTGKESSESEQYAPSTPSTSMIDDIETATPKIHEYVSSVDIGSEKEGTEPNAYESSTISIPIEKGEEATTEPDHDQNTVAVVEEDNIQPYLYSTTIRTSLEEEEGTTLYSNELGSGTEDITEENILQLHEHAATASPSVEETMKTTAEPDKGLNTIPGEFTEESSSEASIPEKTTLSHEIIVTESDDTRRTDYKPTITSESSTLPSESTVFRGADHFTVTTEPSFRKEDESIIPTEKTKESATTGKIYFTDEGFIPTSIHDEKLSTGPNAPSIDQEFTTSVPDNVDETKAPTTESILVSSVSSVTVPENLPELPSEQGTELIFGTTEKLSDMTTVMAEIEAHEEPGRIPGEGDCLLNSITYRNNSVVPSTNICHSGCKCVSSIIKCDPIICSSPPDYMDNCQSIYDSPDSCCPTYVCDHPRETVPPQSDNQMSGTESPKPSPAIECRGDQCELSIDTKHPDDPSEKPESHDCGPEGCQSIEHKPDDSKYALGHPESCKDGKCISPTDDCSNGKCEVPATHELVCDPEHGCQAVPIKPCEGEHCTATIDEVAAQSPQLCKNKEDCKDVTPCVGDSCKFEVSSPQDTLQVSCKDDDGCKSEQITPQECTGDSCRIPEVGHNLPSECEGSKCVQQTENAAAEGTQPVNTESSVQQQTPVEVITEKLETIEDEHKTTVSQKEIEMEISKVTPETFTVSQEMGSESEYPEGFNEIDTKAPEEKHTTLSESYATESDKSPLTTEKTIISVTEIIPESQTIIPELPTPTPDKDLGQATPGPVPEVYVTESQQVGTETSDKQDKSMVSTETTVLLETDNKTPSSDKQTTISENVDHDYTTVSYGTEIADITTPVNDLAQFEVTKLHEITTQAQEIGTQTPVVYESSTGYSEIKPVSDVNEQTAVLGVETDTEKPADDYKIPETSVTSDSVGMVSKTTEPTTEEDYGFTDTPEYASPDKKPQETGPVEIEPQEGTTESQKSPTVAQESTTRAFDIPEYITEKDQIRTELPIEIPHVNEFSHVTDEKQTESPEQYGGIPEQPITKAPVVESVSEELDTEATPVIKEYLTEIPSPSTSEPERSFTEIEDTFVTGEDQTTTEKSIPEATMSIEHFDKSRDEPSTTEKLHDIVEMSLPSSEKPLYPDSLSVVVTEAQKTTAKDSEQHVTDKPQGIESEMPVTPEKYTPGIDIGVEKEPSPGIELPETIPESEKPEAEENDQITEVGITEKNIPKTSEHLPTESYELITKQPHQDTETTEIAESHKVSTESPILITTASMESVEPVKDITSQEDKNTYIPETENIQVHLSTKAPEMMITEQETETELPQKEYSKKPGPYVTESYESVTQDVSTKLEESQEVELLKTTTEVPSSPAIKEVSTEGAVSMLHELNTESDIQKQSTDSSITIEEMRTELPVSQYTSKLPESIVTEPKEYSDTTSPTPVATKDETIEPGFTHISQTTKSQEEVQTESTDTITKTPEDTKQSEMEVAVLEEHITKAPVDEEEPEPGRTGLVETITKAPEDVTELQPEVTGQDNIFKSPEDTKESESGTTDYEEGVTKAPEDSKKSQPEITQEDETTKAPEMANADATIQEEKVTKAPEVMKVSEPEVTRRKEDSTKAPEVMKESVLDVTAQDEAEVTKAPDAMYVSDLEVTGQPGDEIKPPEDTKESIPKVTSEEEEITKAPEDTKQSESDFTTQEEEVTKAPADKHQTGVEVTGQGEDVTMVPEDTKESVPEITRQEEKVTKAPEGTKESLPEITGQGEEVTKAPEEMKESLPEITKQEEEVTKAAEDKKESLPEITEQGEEVTKAPEDSKESLPEITKHEEEVTKAPEDTKESLPEITGQGEEVTEAPEDTKESLPEVTKQDEEVTKAPEDTKEILLEITKQEEEVTKAPEDTRESQPEITGQEDKVTKAPEDTKDSLPEITKQEEDVTKTPEDMKESLPEITGQGEEVTKAPEDSKESLPENTKQVEEVTKAPEGMTESLPDITKQGEEVTKAPEDTKESLPEITKQEEEVTKAPEGMTESLPAITGQGEEVTKAPEDTKESLPEITKQEEEVPKAPEDTKESLPEMTKQEEEVTRAPEGSKESLPEITRQGGEVTKAPEDMIQSLSEITKPDEEVTKAPEDMKEILPEITKQEEEVTKSPEDTKEALPEITGQGEEVTKAPEDTKESLPEITGQGEEVTKAPEDTKVSLPELTIQEEDVTKSPEGTKESLPQITGQEEEVTKAPEDMKESLPEITGQEEEVTIAPEDIKESQPEITKHEEEVTVALDDTKESLPGITKQEEGVTKAPEDMKESLPEMTAQGEDVTKTPEDLKESLPENTKQEEDVTKAPEGMTESLPDITGQVEEVTKAPEDTKESLPEITKQEEEVTKAPEDTKESLSEITGQGVEVTKAPEDTKESLPEITKQEEEVTKAPEDTKETLSEITGQGEEVTKAPEDTNESLPEITGQGEEVTKAPEDTNESLPEITGQGEEVTKAPEDTNESLPEITKEEEEVTKAPEDTKESLPEITGQGEDVTKAPEDTKESLPEITKQEEEVTKTPEDTKESLPEITGQSEEVTKAPEDTKESLPEITKQGEEVTKVPEGMKDLESQPEVTFEDDKVTKAPEGVKGSEPEVNELSQGDIDTEQQKTTPTLLEIHLPHEVITESYPTDNMITEGTTLQQVEEIATEQPKDKFSETTPDVIILEEHTHKIMEEPSTASPSHEERTTVYLDTEAPISEVTSQNPTDEHIETATKEIEITTMTAEGLLTVGDSILPHTTLPTFDEITEKVLESSVPTEDTSSDHKVEEVIKENELTSAPVSEGITPAVHIDSEKSPKPDTEFSVPTEKIPSPTEKPVHHEIVHETTVAGDELEQTSTKATTTKQEEVTAMADDKPTKPEEKPVESSEVTPSATIPEYPKPIPGETQSTDELPTPEEDSHFPPSGMSGYGEPDYVEEDQSFSPGTCRYGGKVYVSAQQIPRDDPCDFCFCFRSDIICLQQSCPPPIHGCHEEPIQGFCCPRYECPVSMATTINMTTTTTTTTTTLPPHFPTHSYKGAAQRRGCQIKGHTYKVGEVVRSSSGPCLHCTCGGDGQMKCDPKACTPEPMLRQMIAAAVSAKRRR